MFQKKWIKTNPEYVDECEDKFCELPPESAALFSYFNNIDLFHSYLQHFKGDLSFISIHSNHFQKQELVSSWSDP